MRTDPRFLTGMPSSLSREIFLDKIICATTTAKWEPMHKCGLSPIAAL